jgi:hypothetical protein
LEDEVIVPVITEGQAITAGFNFKRIQLLADSVNPNLRLSAIRSDEVDYRGGSVRWSFEYFDHDTLYFFHTTLSVAAFDSISKKLRTGTEVPDGWINSSEAFYIAERNGGEDFRMNNREYKIEASMMAVLIPDSKTFWYINYHSNTRRFSINIDAGVGEIK